MSRRKILLTGERGFIGTNLTMSLRGDLRFEVVLPRTRTFTSRYDQGPSLNVRSSSELRAAIQEADAVVHLAARKGSWFCDEDVADTAAVNLLGTIRVGQLCAQLQKPLLHFGTTAYYHSDESLTLLDEASPKHPQTVYGITKWCAEQSLAEIERLRYFVVRPVYGYGNIGKLAASRSESWPDVVLKGILDKRTEPLLTDLGPDFVKQYTHVIDVCDATLELLELFLADAEVLSGTVVQVGADSTYRFHEIMDAFRAPFEILYDEARDYKKNQVHDYYRLRQLLPLWRPKIDVVEYAHSNGGCVRKL